MAASGVAHAPCFAGRILGIAALFGMCEKEGCRRPWSPSSVLGWGLRGTRTINRCVAPDSILAAERGSVDKRRSLGPAFDNEQPGIVIVLVSAGRGAAR